MTPHNRQEGNWRKVIELATQLREKPDKQHKLEEYLEEFPAKEENVSEAKSRLLEAKSCPERNIQVFKNNYLFNNTVL